MIQVILHSNNRERIASMPENWQEVTPRQMTLIAESLFAPIDMDELDVRLAVILLNMSLAELNNCSPEVMYTDIIPLVEWAKEIFDNCEQLFPKIANKFGRDYYGPTSELDNLRLCEYDAAEKHIQLWQQSVSNEAQDNLFLYQFIACIYRPRNLLSKKGNSTSDVRIPFDQSQIEINASKLQKILPIGTALAIALWYKACKTKITELYRELFDNEEEQEQGSVDNFPLMRMIAKTQIYGDFDKVEQMYLYTALSELSASLEESKRLESLNQQNTDS